MVPASRRPRISSLRPPRLLSTQNDFHIGQIGAQEQQTDGLPGPARHQTGQVTHRAVQVDQDGAVHRGEVISSEIGAIDGFCQDLHQVRENPG